MAGGWFTNPLKAIAAFAVAGVTAVAATVGLGVWGYKTYIEDNDPKTGMVGETVRAIRNGFQSAGEDAAEGVAGDLKRKDYVDAGEKTREALESAADKAEAYWEGLTGKTLPETSDISGSFRSSATGKYGIPDVPECRNPFGKDPNGKEYPFCRNDLGQAADELVFDGTTPELCFPVRPEDGKQVCADSSGEWRLESHPEDPSIN